VRKKAHFGMSFFCGASGHLGRDAHQAIGDVGLKLERKVSFRDKNGNSNPIVKTTSWLSSLEASKVSSFNHSTKSTISISASSRRMGILFNLITLGENIFGYLKSDCG